MDKRSGIIYTTALSVFIAAGVAFTPRIIADDPAKTAPVISIAITDDATKRAILDAYNAAMAADKDFTIVLLQAKVRYRVAEDWRFNVGTMMFSPPPAIVAPPTPSVKLPPKESQ